MTGADSGGILNEAAEVLGMPPIAVMTTERARIVAERVRDLVGRLDALQKQLAAVRELLAERGFK